jgi:hypothetical protein
MQNVANLVAAIAVILVLAGVASWAWTGWGGEKSSSQKKHDKSVTKIALVLLGGGACVGVGVWLWWALWGNDQGHAPHLDRWLDVVTGLGAIAIVLAVLGGAFLAARYGRRASISMAADISELPDGSLLIAARPEVKSVGFVRAKFHGSSGAVIRVSEVYAVERSVSQTGLMEGDFRLAPATFGEREDLEFAESGEALRTTVLFRVPAPDGVIGWMVDISIKAPTRWMPGSGGAWGDKVFVARPKVGVVAPQHAQ